MYAPFGFNAYKQFRNIQHGDVSCTFASDLFNSWDNKSGIVRFAVRSCFWIVCDFFTCKYDFIQNIKESENGVSLRWLITGFKME